MKRKTTDTVLLTSPDYRQFIEDLKARVTSARISAARSLTHEIILLYLDVGRGIVEKQQRLGWGDSVVEMVAADLRRAFPEMRGWSPGNVWRMRQLHLVCTSEEFLAQVAREIALPRLPRIRQRQSTVPHCDPPALNKNNGPGPGKPAE